MALLNVISLPTPKFPNLGFHKTRLM